MDQDDLNGMEPEDFEQFVHDSEALRAAWKAIENLNKRISVLEARQAVGPHTYVGPDQISIIHPAKEQ